MLVVGAFIRPRGKKTKLGQMTYECGEQPVGSAWIKFNVRFYIIAIVFLIFDVEVATVFPTIVTYKDAVANDAAGLAFAKIFLFVALLFVGLLYSWARGDLDWVKGIASTSQKKK